jgi:hypothetical protein
MVKKKIGLAPPERREGTALLSPYSDADPAP